MVSKSSSNEYLLVVTSFKVGRDSLSLHAASAFSVGAQMPHRCHHQYFQEDWFRLGVGPILL